MKSIFWIIVIAVVAVYFGWQGKDRKKHPEKWAAIDEEARKRRAEKREREYQKAMERVPASQWMRMTKHQKADVLERREKVAKNRP
jgi:Flp pilus assembly protein TadB